MASPHDGVRAANESGRLTPRQQRRLLAYTLVGGVFAVAIALTGGISLFYHFSGTSAVVILLALVVVVPIPVVAELDRRRGHCTFVTGVYEETQLGRPTEAWRSLLFLYTRLPIATFLQVGGEGVICDDNVILRGLVDGDTIEVAYTPFAHLIVGLRIVSRPKRTDSYTPELTEPTDYRLPTTLVGRTRRSERRSVQLIRSLGIGAIVCLIVGGILGTALAPVNVNLAVFGWLIGILCGAVGGVIVWPSVDPTLADELLLSEDSTARVTEASQRDLHAKPLEAAAPADPPAPVDSLAPITAAPSKAIANESAPDAQVPSPAPRPWHHEASPPHNPAATNTPVDERNTPAPVVSKTEATPPPQAPDEDVIQRPDKVTNTVPSSSSDAPVNPVSTPSPPSRKKTSRGSTGHKKSGAKNSSGSSKKRKRR